MDQRPIKKRNNWRA